MPSLTIHDLDKQLGTLLRQRAREEGLSLNKTVKKLLEKALGIRPRDEGVYRADFQEFCGKWSVEEAAEFDKAGLDFEQVDPPEWE